MPRGLDIVFGLVFWTSGQVDRGLNSLYRAFFFFLVVKNHSYLENTIIVIFTLTFSYSIKLTTVLLSYRLYY